MVVVLPWHDPMRVAEQISMLDHLSGGRMILGLGRGAGKVEFDGFRLEMGDEPRAVRRIRRDAAQGPGERLMEYDGKHSSSRRRAIRPAPFKSFRGRTYAAAVSPRERADHGAAGRRPADHSAEAVAEVEKELTEYNSSIARSTAPTRRSRSRPAGPSSIESAERAREMAMKYIGGYYQTVLDHYQFAGEHMKNQRATSTTPR